MICTCLMIYSSNLHVKPICSRWVHRREKNENIYLNPNPPSSIPGSMNPKTSMMLDNNRWKKKSPRSINSPKTKTTKKMEPRVRQWKTRGMFESYGYGVPLSCIVSWYFRNSFIISIFISGFHSARECPLYADGEGGGGGCRAFFLCYIQTRLTNLCTAWWWSGYLCHRLCSLYNLRDLILYF